MSQGFDRLSNRRIPVGWALAIAVVCVVGIELLVGYGNDYASCVRTAETRKDANNFWLVVAGVRTRQAEEAERFRKRVESVDGSGALTKVVEDYFAAERVEDYAAANQYRRNAIQQVPDCGRFPPPTD